MLCSVSIDHLTEHWEEYKTVHRAALGYGRLLQVCILDHPQGSDPWDPWGEERSNSQYAEKTLNKIQNHYRVKGVRIYFSWNCRCKHSHRIHQPDSIAKLARIAPKWLSWLSGGFYGVHLPWKDNPPFIHWEEKNVLVDLSFNFFFLNSSSKDKKFLEWKVHTKNRFYNKYGIISNLLDFC